MRTAYLVATITAPNGNPIVDNVRIYSSPPAQISCEAGETLALLATADGSDYHSAQEAMKRIAMARFPWVMQFIS